MQWVFFYINKGEWHKSVMATLFLQLHVSICDTRGSQNQFSSSKNGALRLDVGGDRMLLCKQSKAQQTNKSERNFLRCYGTSLFERFQLLLFTPFIVNTCKSQFYFDKILDILLCLVKSSCWLWKETTEKPTRRIHASAFGNIYPAFIWSSTVRNLNSHPPLFRCRSLYNDIT